MSLSKDEFNETTNENLKAENKKGAKNNRAPLYNHKPASKDAAASTDFETKPTILSDQEEAEVNSLLQSIPNLYLAKFNTILSGRNVDNVKRELVKFVKKLDNDMRAARILQGLSGCAAIMLATQNKPADDVVKEEIIKGFCARLNNKKKVIDPKTLQNHTSIIENIFGEDVLSEFSKTKTLPPAGEAVFDIMMEIPWGYCRVAASTNEPLRALKIAKDHLMGDGYDKNYSLPRFEQDIAGFRKEGRKTKSAEPLEGRPEEDENDKSVKLDASGHEFLTKLKNIMHGKTAADICRKALSLLYDQTELLLAQKGETLSA